MIHVHVEAVKSTNSVAENKSRYCVSGVLIFIKAPDFFLLENGNLW